MTIVKCRHCYAIIHKVKGRWIDKDGFWRCLPGIPHEPLPDDDGRLARI